MAISENLNQEFLRALKEVQKILEEMSFVKHSFNEKGYAYYAQYKKHNTIVEFLFGAPEFQIEMIIYTSKGKYAFRDLIKTPFIEKWVNDNRYVQMSERKISSELLWFVDLLKVSLTEIE